MLAAALRLLDERGAEAFTLRALADALGVNPMTLHHRFGDRDGLVQAMADRVYSAAAAPDQGDGVRRIGALLRAYHAAVVRHPGLALLIFARPGLFPRQARRITEELSRLLAETGLPPAPARLWLDILVDFTHGAAIATAMAARAGRAAEGDEADAAGDDDAGDRYAAALAELLDGLRREP